MTVPASAVANPTTAASPCKAVAVVSPATTETAAMPRRVGPRKYDPLTRYLADLAADEVTLTFAEIEAIIGAPLPPSARTSNWWENTTEHVQAGAWVLAGWRMKRTHRRLDPPAVTFERVAVEP